MTDTLLDSCCIAIDISKEKAWKVLLGPQVRFNLGKIKEEAAKVNPGLPVDVIDMKDYGMMNGEKVYNYAKKLMDE